MPQSETQQQNADRLLAFFERQDDEGLYHYKDEDVRHFLPLLVLTMATESGDTEWPAATRQMMDEFVRNLGLEENASADQLNQAIEAYYQANPVNEELRKDFQLMVRELFASGSSTELTAAASKLLGMTPQTLQPKDPSAPGMSVTDLLISGMTDEEEA